MIDALIDEIDRRQRRTTMPAADPTTKSPSLKDDSPSGIDGDRKPVANETLVGDDTATTDQVEAEPNHDQQPDETPARRRRWSRIVAYGVLPGLALVLTLAAGYLKWDESTARENAAARQESSAVARQSTVAILSYEPGTARQQLEAAHDLLTGTFQDSYTKLTNEVVIPGAEQKKIIAVASVPAVASVSADAHHAVALVFVNQRITIGAEAPADTASAVRVTLDKIGDRWLLAGFDPV